MPLYNPKANLKIFFDNNIDSEMTNYNILNICIIQKFNQYATANVKDYSLQNYIQVSFNKFEAKHFDKSYNSTQKLVRYYCYLYRYQIDYNYGTDKTYIITILKAIDAK